MKRSGRGQRILKRRRELTPPTMSDKPQQPRRVTGADQDVSRQVRILRQASGLTLVEMASALGVSWQQMHKYEM